MKKRFISICVISTLVLSLCGCKGNVTSNNNKEQPNNKVENNLSDSKDSDENLNDKSSDENKDNKDTESKTSVETTTPPKDNTTSDNNKEETKPSEGSSKTLSSKELNWYFMPRKDEVPPRCIEEGAPMLKKYSAYYLGDTSQKIIYLTFDEGYENGYSAKILDVLKENNVKAAFFVTTPYINSNKELVKRMVREGHLVCNHSTTHPSMASIKDDEKFKKEFSGCEKAFKDLTGKDMPKYFRPPMGKFSELSLKRTKDLGYKTIFWSFAYRDWEPASQPSYELAKKTIMERVHPGAVYLLHAVSKTNTEVLGDVIKDLKSKGYTFKSLDELPSQSQVSNP
ncbi:delta-lactam-biosynthetic de-N-acetylase [Haloimpatiens lingqiaonensis]|uniref:delta-lactam-biosynthetic de-N-acetylase n=1 Tax=Haloimpatiens lingqiaonensis TaxID=1380675 RepID=UPI0010FCF52D|nr:delta-lactam-biosynthetic de-N-acetylase [Haloimpatiens lingqiaonensis]